MKLSIKFIFLFAGRSERFCRRNYKQIHGPNKICNYQSIFHLFGCYVAIVERYLPDYLLSMFENVWAFYPRITGRLFWVVVGLCAGKNLILFISSRCSLSLPESGTGTVNFLVSQNQLFLFAGALWKSKFAYLERHASCALIGDGCKPESGTNNLTDLEMSMSSEVVSSMETSVSGDCQSKGLQTSGKKDLSFCRW